jgi:hypothetical protein
MKTSDEIIQQLREVADKDGKALYATDVCKALYEEAKKEFDLLENRVLKIEQFLIL